MVSKHTPGPWVAHDLDSYPYVVADEGKRWDNPTICDLFEDVTPETSVTIGAWLKPYDNAEANARLIAAAPDAIEALELALEYWAHRQQRYKNRHPVWVVKARAAIAKATGA